MKRTLAYRITFIGNMEVGKTTLIEHILNSNELTPDFQPYIPTIGLDVKTKYFNINGTMIKSHLYDTSGNPLFNELCISYRKQSDILCIVYDVSNRKSFDSIPYWISLRPIHAHMRTLLIGNRVNNDNDKKRVVSYEEGTRLSIKYNIDFIETNVINNNITSKLEEMMHYIHTKSIELHDNENLLLLNNRYNETQSKCCIIL
jgi:small GTP-binding protein